ncbi:MAG TPA: hypothetical protein VIL34_20650 [Actinopolymorphaceae bacterium]|jgi:hypothetical protein
MIDRFAVRKTGRGYGVWDAAVNGWHSRQDLSESEATQLAATMNAAHRTPSRPQPAPSQRATPSEKKVDNRRATAPHPNPGRREAPSNQPATASPPSGVISRRVDPATPVLVLVDGRWWPAHLDWWVRETDGWYGRASLDATGAVNWYPAKSLRKCSST